ncbi:permease-like cell division protein FtsX [Patescibacteria group bacterium]|nr:permease-like cell division protein FtsX [Patescibacteria group bacterium]
MTSFFRILKFALQDIWRNIGLSFMTIMILVLMLLSVNVLWSVDILTKEAVNLVKEQINVSLYLSGAITDKELTELKNYISSFPEVVNLDVRSRDDVLNNFEERHKMSQEVLDALNELGANPFGPTIIIKTKEPGDYKKIIDSLSVPEYDYLIEAKSFDQHEEAIDRIQNITSRVEQMGMGLSILFAIIAFLIIFNTIRVSIFTHHTEIGIKRLVGASNWFIRGPYLVESFLFTVASIGVTMVLVFLALGWIDPYLNIAFPTGFSLTNYYNSNILMIFGIQALAVLLLNILSSWLAMRRQLKV